MVGETLKYGKVSSKEKNSRRLHNVTLLIMPRYSEIVVRIAPSSSKL